MKWRIECKHSGDGESFEGSLDEAIARATELCVASFSRWVLWYQPANVRMAEVTQRGAEWVKSRLTGPEIVFLMRRYKKTIAGLSFVMGITQSRIRRVRDIGLSDRNAVRDWLEAITGEDPGPLPERYRISRRDEETDCCYCGCPLFIGDHAYEYGMAAFCSVSCARLSRGWGKSEKPKRPSLELCDCENPGQDIERRSDLELDPTTLTEGSTR